MIAREIREMRENESSKGKKGNHKWTRVAADKK